MQMSLSASCGPEEREQQKVSAHKVCLTSAPFTPFGLPTAGIAMCEQQTTRQKNALFLCFFSLQFVSLKARARVWN